VHGSPTHRPVLHGRKLLVPAIVLTAICSTVGVAVALTNGSDEEAASEISVSGGELIANATEDQVQIEGADLIGVESSKLADIPDLGCTTAARSMRMGAAGEGVTCLQRALKAVGVYDGPATGEFDEKTNSAVVEFQRQFDLYVDGVVGEETASLLKVWPDNGVAVVRTPEPAAGAVDLWGVTLSPVASAGVDAPPVPADSGSGYRVVYDRTGQRAWAIDGDERVIRSWLVSGSTFSNERPGTYEVYSRSELSTAWHGEAFLPYMVRYLRTDLGHIGFHGIPTSVTDGSVYQTTDELGTRLSGGCQRQHDLDAMFMWGFAPVGTTVVVI